MSKKHINREQERQTVRQEQNYANTQRMPLEPPRYVKPPDFDIVIEGYVPFGVLWNNIKTEWHSRWDTFTNVIKQRIVKYLVSWHQQNRNL